MISHEELKKSSKKCLDDSKILFRNKRYEGAIYICGYSIEIALKGIICKNLNIGGFISTSHIPSTKEELKKIEEFFIHDLDRLLSKVPPQIAAHIKAKKMTEWSTVLKWNPEMRYAPIKKEKKQKENSQESIRCAEIILKYLWRLI